MEKVNKRPLVLGYTAAVAGVAGFSLTLPVTKYAMRSIPWEMAGPGRGLAALILVIPALALAAGSRPAPRLLWRLFAMGLAVVVLFPWLTAKALLSVPAGHGAMVYALIPVVMAWLGVWRHRERPEPVFWVFSSLAFAIVFTHAVAQIEEGFAWADIYLLVALIVVAFGYSEGAALSRHLPSWQVISWALLLNTPVMLVFWWDSLPLLAKASWAGWAGYLYLGLVSQWLAFVLWYFGLKSCGLTAAGQVQHGQLFLTLMVSHMLLGETIGGYSMLVAVAVTVCIVLAVKKG